MRDRLILLWKYGCTLFRKIADYYRFANTYIAMIYMPEWMKKNIVNFHWWWWRNVTKPAVYPASTLMKYQMKIPR